VIKLQCWPVQRNFQAGLIARVAGQQVGQSVGTRIHGTTDRNPQVLIAIAATILKAGLQSRLDDGNAHETDPESSLSPMWSAWPMTFSNACTDMGLNRTMSPGAIRVGGC